MQVSGSHEACCYTRNSYLAAPQLELRHMQTLRTGHHLPGIVHKGGSAHGLCYFLSSMQHQVGNGNGFLKHPACCTSTVTLCLLQQGGGQIKQAVGALITEQAIKYGSLPPSLPQPPNWGSACTSRPETSR